LAVLYVTGGSKFISDIKVLTCQLGD